MAKLTYVFDRRCEYTGCGKELFGRSDKKYCNDECRNRANSIRRRSDSWGEDKCIYEIIRDLRRNRAIMKSSGAFLNDTKIVTRGWMLDKGYNFEYHTNILHTKKGDYFFCFEFGHMILEEGKVLIVMTDRYIEFKARIHGPPMIFDSQTIQTPNNSLIQIVPNQSCQEENRYGQRSNSLPRSNWKKRAIPLGH